MTTDPRVSNRDRTFPQKHYEESAATNKRAIVFRAALMRPDDPRWVDIPQPYAIVLRVLEECAEAEAVEVRATGILAKTPRPGQV